MVQMEFKEYNFRHAKLELNLKPTVVKSHH